jgi:hypothetical protein
MRLHCSWRQLAFLRSRRRAGANLATGRAFVRGVLSGEGVRQLSAEDTRCVIERARMEMDVHHVSVSPRVGICSRWRGRRSALAAIARDRGRGSCATCIGGDPHLTSRRLRRCRSVRWQMRGELSLLVYHMPRPVCILSPFFARPPSAPLFVSPARFVVLLARPDRKFPFWDESPRTFFPLFQYLSRMWSSKRAILAVPSRPRR